MWRFLILITISLASSDKLDRKYLPPPGSKYSGGNFAESDVPFEFPKLSYATTKHPNLSSEVDSPFGQISPDKKIHEEIINQTTNVNTNDQKQRPSPLTTENKVLNPENHIQTTVGIDRRFLLEEPSRPLNFIENETNIKKYLPKPHVVPSTTPFIIPTTTYSNRFVPNYNFNIETNKQISDDNVPNYFQQNTSITSQPSQKIAKPGNTYLPVNQNIYQSNITAFPTNVSLATRGDQPGLVNQRHHQYSGVQPPSSSNYKNNIQLNQFDPIQKPTKVPEFRNQYYNNPSLIQFGRDSIPKALDDVYQNPMIESLEPKTPQNTYAFATSAPKDTQDVTDYNQSRNSQLDLSGKPIFYEDNISKISSTQQYPETSVFQTNAPQEPSTSADYNFKMKFPIPSEQAASNYPTSTTSYLNSDETYSRALPKYLDKSSNIANTPRFERPQAKSDREAETLNYEKGLTPQGYHYSYDTSNGIHADESATTIDGTKASGSYSYIGDDGKLYKVIYTADENGFVPFGDHLPTPPPIPEAIQRVIEQAERDRDAGIVHDGFYDDNKYGYKNYVRPSHTKKAPNINYDNIAKNFKNIDQELELSEPIHFTPNDFSQKQRPINSVSRKDNNENDLHQNHGDTNININPKVTKSGQINNHMNPLNETEDYQEQETKGGLANDKHHTSEIVSNDEYNHNNYSRFIYKSTTFKPEINSGGKNYVNQYEKPNTFDIQNKDNFDNRISNNIPVKAFEDHTLPQSSTVRINAHENTYNDNGYEYTPPKTIFNYNNQFPLRNEDKTKEITQTTISDKSSLINNYSNGYYTATDVPEGLVTNFGKPIFGLKTFTVKTKPEKPNLGDAKRTEIVEIPSTTYIPNKANKNKLHYNGVDSTAAGQVNVETSTKIEDNEGALIKNRHQPNFNENNHGFEIKPDTEKKPRFEDNSEILFNGKTGNNDDKRMNVRPVNKGPSSNNKAGLEEYFSGPKQPQRFDPKSGYYY